MISKRNMKAWAWQEFKRMNDSDHEYKRKDVLKIFAVLGLKHNTAVTYYQDFSSRSRQAPMP